MMKRKWPKPVVAIDGPAGAGKSTLARALAERLGSRALDTGAMYRAVAWSALERGIGPEDLEDVGKLASSLKICLGDRVIVDGEDVTSAIRTPEVDRAVSLVAANPLVRRVLVERQRVWVDEHGGGVVEGRDIGTVVLPDADLKVYLTADLAERARRRAAEADSGGDARAEQLSRRDALDAQRGDSPLPSVGEAARDALVIDSTKWRAEEVVEAVVKALRARL